MKTTGLSGLVYGYEDEPAYFSFSSLAFRVAKFFHELTPKIFSTQLFIFLKNLSEDITDLLAPPELIKNMVPIHPTFTRRPSVHWTPANLEPRAALIGDSNF
jgi:hypothetical protein